MNPFLAGASDFSERLGRKLILHSWMAHLSFALLEAHRRGASLNQLADTLELPVEFVSERVEAARLCSLLLNGAQ